MHCAQQGVWQYGGWMLLASAFYLLGCGSGTLIFVKLSELPHKAGQVMIYLIDMSYMSV